MVTLAVTQAEWYNKKHVVSNQPTSHCDHDDATVLARLGIVDSKNSRDEREFLFS